MRRDWPASSAVVAPLVGPADRAEPDMTAGVSAVCQDCGAVSPAGAEMRVVFRWAEEHVAPGHSVVAVSTPVNRMVADLRATHWDES